MVFKCDICGKAYTARKNLIWHIKSTHSADKENLTRNVCGTVFTRRDALSRHMKGHITKPEYQCNKCSKIFYRRNSLLQHIQMYTDRCNGSPDGKPSHQKQVTSVQQIYNIGHRDASDNSKVWYYITH